MIYIIYSLTYWYQYEAYMKTRFTTVAQIIQIHAILRSFFQVYLGEPVLSQRKDVPEQPLDFYDPDVLPVTQPVMSKHYRKPSDLVVFCFIDMV